MPLDTVIFWMIIMLLLGVVIGMTLAQKHIPAMMLFLLLAVALILFIYIVQGGHSPHFS